MTPLPPHEPFWKKATGSLPKTEFQALETYVQIVSTQVNNPSNRTHDNLPKEECQALYSIRRQSDIIIKPADKGSAVVAVAYLGEGKGGTCPRRHFRGALKLT